MDGIVLGLTSTEEWGKRIATLPEGFRPPDICYRTGIAADRYWDRVSPARIHIHPDGSVAISYKGFVPYTVQISCTFPCM